MKYHELTREQKKELRENLYFESLNPDGYTDFDHLSIEDQNIVLSCEDADDIPEAVMEAAYECYDFSEDDFFCTVGDACPVETTQKRIQAQASPMQIALYDRISAALTDYEMQNASKEQSLKDFYGLLCEVHRRMAEAIN